MFTLIVIAHFAGKAPEEHVVRRHIPTYTACLMEGFKAIGRPLGAEDVAFRCERES